MYRRQKITLTPSLFHLLGTPHIPEINCSPPLNGEVLLVRIDSLSTLYYTLTTLTGPPRPQMKSSAKVGIETKMKAFIQITPGILELKVGITKNSPNTEAHLVSRYLSWGFHKATAVVGESHG